MIESLLRMSYEEILAEQLSELNQVLNEILAEAVEAEETREIVLTIQGTNADIAVQLQSGNLQGLIGRLMLLVLTLTRLYTVIQGTESGQKLQGILDEIKDYYLNAGNTPTQTSIQLEAEELQEETELEQARCLDKKVFK